MKAIQQPLRIASFLEELAHNIMNIKDEKTVQHVVTAMYNQIKTDGYRYYLAG